ncbi:MAG: hypothetical protein WAU31_04845, partial [Candidatus Moraniibacteriota bacterium]
MEITLKNNAYHILGLDTSASEADILKRSKEIINRLRVDNIPKYDLDIDLFENFRNEKIIKDALQRLQLSKKRIREYFFWFQIADGIDEQALKLVKSKDYKAAVQVWKVASQEETTKAYLYKKNLAILEFLLLEAGNGKEYLQSSVLLWRSLIDSEKFWTLFFKLYKLHDEQTGSQKILSDFMENIGGDLADMYTELHLLHNDASYINEFQKIFSIKGEKIEKNILAPAYNVINQAVQELENMNVSEDDIFDRMESEKIKRLVAVIQQELNKLMDLGLYEDSQTRVMRDRSANALRTIALDLHNNLSELDKSLGLHGIAVNLAGTESLKSKLKSELEQIKENIKDDTENSLEIEIPGIWRNSTIVFKNNFFVYKKKKIFYKDVASISFNSTATTSKVYGVPVSTSYKYRWSVIAGKENVALTLSA